MYWDQDGSPTQAVHLFTSSHIHKIDSLRIILGVRHVSCPIRILLLCHHYHSRPLLTLSTAPPTHQGTVNAHSSIHSNYAIFLDTGRESVCELVFLALAELAGPMLYILLLATSRDDMACTTATQPTIRPLPPHSASIHSIIHISDAPIFPPHLYQPNVSTTAQPYPSPH
jgi:hypothetical protein